MIDWALRAGSIRAIYSRICGLGVKVLAPRVKLGDGTRFLGLPLVDMKPGSRIVLGTDCSLISRSSQTALGVNHACTLRTARPDAVITIGNDVGMSGGTICAAERIDIGDRVLLGANVTIVDSDMHEVEAVPRRYGGSAASAPVVIGDDVFLGTGAIVLKGVTIGAGTVVGAGSVVSCDLPEHVVAAGSPARVLRKLGTRSTVVSEAHDA